MCNQNKNLPYFLIIMAIILGFYTLDMLYSGMFFDGITYSGMAHNLYLGVGSIKEPIFFIHPTNIHPELGVFSSYFYEHPVLMFWIESLSYKILGDHIWVDKLLLIIIMMIQCILIYNITRQLNKLYKDLHLNYLVVIIILLMSDTVRFVFVVNFCENFLTTFCMLSFLCVTLINKDNSKFKNIIYYFLSVFFVLIAMLCNGLVALSFLLIHPLLNFKPNKLKSSLTYFILPFILFALLLFLCSIIFPDLMYNFHQYLNVQLLPSLNGGLRAGENTQVMGVFMRVIWYISKIVLTDNIFFLVVFVLVISFKKVKKIQFVSPFWRLILLFLLCSFPIVISTPRSVGSTRFFDQSFFILSFVQAILLSDIYSQVVIDKVLSHKFFRYFISIVTAILIVINVIVFLRNDIKPDRYAVPIVSQIKQIVPIDSNKKNSAICSTDVELVKDTNLQSYMIRYLSTNIIYLNNCHNQQYIISKNKYPITPDYHEFSLYNKLYFYTRIK